MPTKPKKKVAQREPQVRFYLSEDIRQEVNGKVTAIGLYPDNVVVMHIPDELPEPTESVPLFIRSLSFLFSIANLSRAAPISVEIESNGKRSPFMASKKHPSTGPGGSMNMIGVMQPCPITSFGVRELIVRVGDSVHSFTFEIRRASLSKISDTPKQAVVTKKNRTGTTLAKK